MDWCLNMGLEKIRYFGSFGNNLKNEEKSQRLAFNNFPSLNKTSKSNSIHLNHSDFKISTLSSCALERISLHERK